MFFSYVVPTGREAKQIPSPTPHDQTDPLFEQADAVSLCLGAWFHHVCRSPYIRRMGNINPVVTIHSDICISIRRGFWQALRFFVMVAPTIALRKGRRASGPLRYLSRQHGLPWLLFPDTLCPDPLLVVLWAFSGVCCWKPRHEIIHDYLKMIPKFAYISGFVLEYNPFSDINPWKLL